MDASSNLAEAREPQTNEFVKVTPMTTQEAAAMASIAKETEATQVPEPEPAPPTPPEWKMAFSGLKALNTQAGALVQYQGGLVFIPGCHVTDLNIFDLDSPASPVRRLGRPKGSKNKGKGGRPKGSKNKAKRGPGRPKGKRGPGRPKGSKNKAK